MLGCSDIKNKENKLMTINTSSAFLLESKNKLSEFYKWKDYFCPFIVSPFIFTIKTACTLSANKCTNLGKYLEHKIFIFSDLIFISQ